MAQQRHPGAQPEGHVKIEETALPGVLLLTPKAFGDDRGTFMEAFRQDVFAGAAPGVVFVQDNVSLSRRKGTVRGLHYQRPPMGQGKLVRCGRGAILDVAVDIRSGSPNYGRHVAVELGAENRRQLWVPSGFLHGFCTLTDDAEVLYKVTAHYSPQHDGAVAWDDPDLGIAWPVDAASAILSAKDAAAPRLRDAGALFAMGGQP
jgi:dTDP-4-dehydrorhamnose 3,5-epimerase